MAQNFKRIASSVDVTISIGYHLDIMSDFSTPRRVEFNEEGKAIVMPKFDIKNYAHLVDKQQTPSATVDAKQSAGSAPARKITRGKSDLVCF